MSHLIEIYTINEIMSTDRQTHNPIKKRWKTFKTIYENYRSERIKLIIDLNN